MVDLQELEALKEHCVACEQVEEKVPPGDEMRGVGTGGGLEMVFLRVQRRFGCFGSCLFVFLFLSDFSLREDFLNAKIIYYFTENI